MTAKQNCDPELDLGPERKKMLLGQSVKSE